MIGFTLTMPNVNSWNGKWTGEDSLHYVSRKLSKQTELKLHNQSFDYNFGDGWRAEIDCKIVDAITNKKLKKKSTGFCGYEWMIDSIILHGEIRRRVKYTK